jgi:hypothetical protein
MIRFMMASKESWMQGICFYSGPQPRHSSRCGNHYPAIVSDTARLVKIRSLDRAVSDADTPLPNGGVVRLPLGVGQAVLVEVIRVAGALRPWKAPES